ncbi:hypothetical protein KSS87_014898, partial [Heliosperma pusillum]
MTYSVTEFYRGNINTFFRLPYFSEFITASMLKSRLHVHKVEDIGYPIYSTYKINCSLQLNELAKMNQLKLYSLE